MASIALVMATELRTNFRRSVSGIPDKQGLPTNREGLKYVDRNGCNGVPTDGLVTDRASDVATAFGVARRDPRRALREGEGGKVTSVLYRRGCGRSQGHGGGLREALSWHLGHRQRRLQQRAGLRDRPAAQRQEGHHRLRAVSDHPRLSPVGQGGSADAFQT